MSEEPQLVVGGEASAERQQPDGGGNEDPLDAERAAMELLEPLERVLMASLLDMGWKIGLKPGKNGSSKPTSPKLSFISPTNQVFDAWDEVTQFFGQTSEQEGWFAGGSNLAVGRNKEDSALPGTEVGGASRSEPSELGFLEQGAEAAGGIEQAEKQQRPLNGVIHSLEPGAAGPSQGPLQTSLSQEPDLLSTLEEAGTVHAEELALAAEIMKELEERKERLLLSAPEPSPLPVAAARRSPLPPPMASASLEGHPLVFQGFQPAAVGARGFPIAAPAKAFGGQNFNVAAGRPESNHSGSTLEGNSKGGFVYERKDGVKVYHKEACKCRGCTAKRKSGEVPGPPSLSPEALPGPLALVERPNFLQSAVLPALPWELTGDRWGGGETTPVLDEAAAAVAAAVRSLELQGVEVSPQNLNGLEIIPGLATQRFDRGDEYLTADESPQGSVSLEGGLGGLAGQEDDTAFWQTRGGEEEAGDDDGAEGSDVEDLDVFLPRIMEQTGFTPLLAGQDAFMGFGPEAYAAMQAAVPVAAEDQSALVLYEPLRSELDHLSAEQQEALDLGTTRKRNAYLCKRCGQIKKGHKCNPAAARTSSRRSLSGPPSPDATPEAPLPPPEPVARPPVEPPKPPPASPSLQPYSFSSLSKPPPPLLDDLQSFFSSPREEPPRAAVPSASERPTVLQYAGYRPSKAASAAAIVAVGGQGCPKVVLPKFKDPPTNARLLLATGLLEGQHVSYIMQSGKLLLTGWVKGGGVICDCEKCKGNSLVSLSEFEKHAGSVARHPSDYIFLDDGRNLRQLVEDAQALAAGRIVMSNEIVTREEVPAGALGLDAVAEGACSACGEEGNVLRCSSCSREYHAECVGLERPPSASAQWTCPRCQGGAGHGIYRGPPIARLVHQSPATIRRRTPSNVFSLLFTDNGLPDGEAVSYRIRGETILAGKKARGGIVCGCCSSIVSPSTFEQHAGKGARRNPYTSIFVDSADIHLKDYAQRVEAQGGPSRGEAEAEECAECGDGGNLILCDGCPKGYHPECVRLSAVPKGDWFCGSCDKPRIAAAKAKAAAHPAGGSNASGASDMVARCARLLTEVDTTTGGCILCRMQDFSKTFGDRTIILCDQCEREFHVGCLREHGVADLSELPEGDWFCGGECARISAQLQALLERGPQALPNYVMAGGKPVDDGRERTWQLLRGRQGSKDNGKVLAAAVDILSRCFDPIIDCASGEDLLPMMVHSRQTKDHDFSGMYCLALRAAGKVASCAVIRVFGNKLAEMPLVATSLDARRQGHCRALMTATEWLLTTLGVARLSLPAAEGAEDTWQTGFGFNKMSHTDLQKWRAELQALLVFPGASMLEKVIPPLPGMARPQPSPPSLHPRQLSGRAAGEGGERIMGRPIEEALAAAAEARSRGISKGKRSKTSRSGQGASSAQDEEASGPAASSHSTEEDAPILVQFGRKKTPQPADSDDSVPIAQMHLQLSEAQSPGKRKRGRPPGSGKPKVKSKRGRPRKLPVEGESRPEEATRESDGESVDLGGDGLPPAAKKSRTEGEGGVLNLEGVEGGAKVSPIQLQRKALQHTRPRSILGRQQAKGSGGEDGTESKGEREGPPVDKATMFLANVQKFKDKKRQRREKMLAARLAKMGGDPPEGAAEKVTSASEASSRSTGLKGPRSKRRARVFVPGAEFWLPGREEESEEKQKPSKKMRVVTEKKHKAEVESGAAEKEALVVPEGGSSPAKGSRRKKQKKAGGEEQQDGGGSTASEKARDSAVETAEALREVRVLSKNLEPHTGGDEKDGGGQKSGREAAQRGTADGETAGRDQEAEGKGAKKRRRMENAETPAGEKNFTEGAKGVQGESNKEAEGVDGETFVEQEEAGSKEGAEEGTAGKEVEKRRSRKRARQWGKRKRAPRSGGDEGTEPVAKDSVVDIDFKGDSRPGDEVSPQQEEQIGQTRKHGRSERTGTAQMAAVSEGTAAKGDSSVQGTKNGLTGHGKGVGNGGQRVAELSGGLETKQATGRSAEERPGGLVYRRKKGRGAQERWREAAPEAEAALVKETVETEIVFQGANAAAGREGGREQTKPRPSGLLVKGVKGFLMRQPAASPPADVIPEPPAASVSPTGVLSEKQAKKRLDKAAEKRASGVIVKGVKGFQKKKGPEPGPVVGSQEVVLEGGTGGEVLEAGGNHDREEGEAVTGRDALPQEESAPEMGIGDGPGVEEAVKGGEGGTEPAEVKVVESLRRVGGKGKKKKKGKHVRKPPGEVEVVEELVVRLDQEAADGGLGKEGADASALSLDGAVSERGSGEHADGRKGRDGEKGREEQGEKQGVPNGAGRKFRVPRELQALQAAPGTGAPADGSKGAKAFAGFLSSTRQRVR
ncbi:PHD finger family protein [Klebsormidium nitens]|uniref:PHD finger family protein n=1 Tax=Klebsormidium nitens TaxID=105231 RepID=A0A1Y1I8Q9_KLENI|nr:PHD finger family protein [Klebsormidium nitens]|eukprot:GAQ87364.1 PHD finger family protein [Klebsormidium nitens]